MNIKKLIPLFLIVACMQSLPDFNSLWDYQNPAETETKFRAILSEVNEKKHPEYIAELQTQIARTLGLQQKFEEGHQTLDNISKAALTNPTVQARYLVERGRLFNSNQEQNKALPLFEDAYNHSIEHQLDYYAIDAAHMIAYALIDSPKEKIKWEEAALDLVQKTKDENSKKWEGSLYNNLGWSYFDLKEYDIAKSYFNKSLEFEKSKGNDGKVFIAKWSIAKCERLQGNIQLALASFLDLEKEVNAKELEPDGYVFEEIGECYLSLSDSTAAKPYFALAHKIHSEDAWIQKNEKEKLDRLLELSQ